MDELTVTVLSQPKETGPLYIREHGVGINKVPDAGRDLDVLGKTYFDGVLCDIPDMQANISLLGMDMYEDLILYAPENVSFDIVRYVLVDLPQIPGCIPNYAHIIAQSHMAFIATASVIATNLYVVFFGKAPTSRYVKVRVWYMRA